MQRGLGEAVRSWGGSAVLGVSPMSNCRGSPHEQLPWFPRGCVRKQVPHTAPPH
ncbi:MAG: hypothetical protein F6K26_57105, partial [Moorea sp. SIO2I5]|nr:hypothetical protein [Moorena sp. SIO2I5]